MSGPSSQHQHQHDHATTPGDGPRFSVVVPLFNEAEAIAPLVAEIGEACAGLGPFELILVDDASQDASRASALEQARQHPWLRVLGHDRRGGQSAAVHNGVSAARAAVICTLDGDGQNPPSEIARLVAPLLAPDCAPGLALVAGQRARRRDSLAKRLASVAANRIRGAILRDGTRDTGCGLKAFRRDAFLALPYFDHMHRFLPALFARDGWEIQHVDVGHRPRASGRSKYSNLGRAAVGVVDLAGVAWLLRRRKRARASELSEPDEEPSAELRTDSLAPATTAPQDASVREAALDNSPPVAQHPAASTRVGR